MSDATRGRANPHRDALVQLARWAQQRYEQAVASLRGAVADKARLVLEAHESAHQLFAARAWLEVADGAGDGPLPDGLLLVAPAADAMMVLELENAELRRLLGGRGAGC